MWIVEIVNHLLVGESLVWLPTDRPDLIEDHPVAPHVTGCGVGPVDQGFWCHPLDREWSVCCGRVGIVVHEAPSHSKITNLHNVMYRD